MADFKTHLLGAAVASGIAATGLAMTQSISHQAAIGYFTLGVAGGLMPDIDSQSSIPIRIAYRVLSALVALLVVLNFSGHYSLAELVIMGVASYALIRYGFFSLFNHFTIHRGLVHSLPSAVVFGLITAIVAQRFFGSSSLHAWLCATFMTFGFLIHLMLDEMYSIDLLGRRIKRSFGTAICLLDRNNLTGTLALYGVVAGLMLMCPSTDSFFALLLDNNTYEQIAQRLLPSNGWFNGLLSGSR